VTYIPDNAADTIAECLKRVIIERRYERTAEQAALQTYGPAAMAESLNRLVLDGAARHGKERPMAQTAAPAPADAR
jgi:hypothetical protein